MTDLKSVSVLASSGGHQPTREKVANTFAVVAKEAGDIASMSEADRAKVRGISSLGLAMDAATMDLLPNLEVIASFGVGYDHIDAKAAAERGIVVTHTPTVLDDEVADTAIGLLLNTLRELPKAEQWLRDGKWTSVGNYPLTNLTLRARTVGIYGLGRIGQAIGRRLEGFGVDIHYHSRKPVDGATYTYHATLLDMAKAVDTLIAIVPGTAATHHSIDAAVLKALGSNGVLINVARGPVVDEAALIEALQNNTIAAAGLDVFEFEPKVPQALIDAPNACLLPHVASGSHHTRNAMGQLVYDNLVSWFTEGKAITPTPETAHLSPKK